MVPMTNRETQNDERIFMTSRFATAGPAIERTDRRLSPPIRLAPCASTPHFLPRERQAAANRARSRRREGRLGFARRREHEAAEHAEGDEQVADRDRRSPRGRQRRDDHEMTIEPKTNELDDDDPLEHARRPAA